MALCHISLSDHNPLRLGKGLVIGLLQTDGYIERFSPSQREVLIGVGFVFALHLLIRLFGLNSMTHNSRCWVSGIGQVVQSVWRGMNTRNNVD